MKAKKILALALCAVMLVCISVGATVAYLQATTEAVKNTFTVGTVGATLDEADVDVFGEIETNARVQTNEYKLVPGEYYVKDPTIHLAADTEPVYVFVQVINEIADIEAAGDTTIAAQMDANGWDALGEAYPNIYVYETTVHTLTDATKLEDNDPAVKDEDGNMLVFGSFTLANDAKITADYAEKTIDVKAFIIQANGFDTAEAAWKAGKFELIKK